MKGTTPVHLEKEKVMNTELRQEDIYRALENAGAAHHAYERDYLNGVRDPAWAGWYAAYLLGSLGDIAPPGELTRWLESAEDEEDWLAAAARMILSRLN